MELSEQAISRYARQIVLPEVGGLGQARLLQSGVLIIGAGGLGSPLGIYLAAAGVGRIGIVDDDIVEVSNLQRQITHGHDDLGTAKVDSFAARVNALDPGIAVERHRVRLRAGNADELIARYDLVADGSDNMQTRLEVHDACRRQGRTLVSAAVQGMEGQLSTFKSHLGPPHPCIHCIFPDPAPSGMLPSCAGGGVLGPAAGVMGCLQAVEIVKEILGEPVGTLSGTLLLYDAMAARLDRVNLTRRVACVKGCVRIGPVPTAGAAVAYE